jgi:hypothetical protein
MSELDFWVGDWDAVWDGGTGRNTVTREAGDRVYVERFEALGDEPFSGMSLSVRHAGTGEWRQTWADSEGSYWSFVGSVLADGSFVFATPDRVDEEQAFKRMVFSDVTEEAFHWRWERSRDGETWEQRWAIDYTRRQG